MAMQEEEIPDFIEERDLFGQVKPKLEIQEVEELPAPDLGVEYAGLVSRTIAYILDSFILAIPLIIILGLFFGADWSTGVYTLKGTLIYILVWALYYGITESSDKQATFGKRICGIKVINEHGNKLTFIKAAFRFVLFVPLSFGVGFIRWDKKKQALHDMILGCYVVVKKPGSVDNPPPAEGSPT